MRCCWPLALYALLVAAAASYGLYELWVHSSRAILGYLNG
jgi:hypothetical protein